MKKESSVTSKKKVLMLKLIWYLFANQLPSYIIFFFGKQVFRYLQDSVKCEAIAEKDFIPIGLAV